MGEYAEPSVASAWEHERVCGLFSLPGAGRLFTALSLVDDDEECAISDELDLGPDWGDDGESRRQTQDGRLPLILSGAGIDPEPAAALEDAAMAALARTMA